jgi:DNA invertase Pin-like site-specific DNA recombinase
MAKPVKYNFPALLRRLIGYARVSTDEQVHDAQVDELRAAGCERIFEEQISGAAARLS